MMKEIHEECAGGIIFNENNLLVIVKGLSGKWSFPKGHLKEGKDELTAAKREILEESGIRTLNLIEYLGAINRSRINKLKEQLIHKSIHMYLFITTNQELKPIDPSNPEARWFDKSEVKNILKHPEDIQFFYNMLPYIESKLIK